MKKLYFLLILITICFSKVFSQGPPPALVITEIMYNPPEAGIDSLEFIELRLLNGLEAVPILNFQFVSGIDYIFPFGAQTDANGYVIVAKDSVAFENTFGIPAYQWNNSSLLNTGETITLLNPYQFLDDSVAYDNSFPWPTEADGQGHSLVLCDIYADNYGPENWQASQNNTGIVVNGITIYADPGQSSSCLEVGVAERSEEIGFQVYPNPSNGNFSLQFPELKYDAVVSIYDPKGSLVQSSVLQKGTVRMEMQMRLEAGIYLIRLESDELQQTQRLVITE